MALVARLSYVDYRVSGGRWALPWSVISRAVSQVLFFTLLGQFGAGEAGARFAFVGAIAFVSATATITKIADIIVPDIRQGTLYRLQLGGWPIPRLLVVRSWVYLAEGSIAAVAALALTGPPLIGIRLTLQYAAKLPILILAAFGCLSLGLFVCALCLAGLDDNLTANTSYILVLFFADVVGPSTESAWWSQIPSHVVPLHAALEALRADLAGSPFPLEAVVHEGLVAVFWLSAASLLIRRIEKRIRKGASVIAIT